MVRAMADERRVAQPEVVKVDARLAQRAARQWSIVDLDDLRACGLSQQAVTKRIRAGRLYRFHRGVYAVVPNPPLEGCFLAAVKACGPGAALSHYAAAALYGWVKWDGRTIEVTAPTNRRHPHIRTHRSRDVTRVYVKGIPVTTPAQTVIDLSAETRLKPLRRAVNEALNQRRIRPSDLVTRDHRGAARLRAILATAAPTRNEYEDLVLVTLHLHGIPPPLVNRRRGAYVPDFEWRAERLILEADSVRYHEHLLARADDDARQAVLEAEGFTVLRTTWREVTTRPDRVVARVRAALRPAACEV